MLDALATVADLADRGIDIPATADPVVLLNAASDAVRNAAEHPILVTTGTVTLVTSDWAWLDLPAGPVRSVAAVVVDGLPVDGWAKIGDSIRMPCTRWTRQLPTEITVTYTHGLDTVPGDIVDLVCGMTSMAFAVAGDGYGSSSRTGSVRLGDYAETSINPPGTEAASPLAIPDNVRQALRARFGTAVAVVGQRR